MVFGLAAAFLATAEAAGEIYVTVGEDGIEIFSNLPRQGSAPVQRASGAPTGERGAAAAPGRPQADEPAPPGNDAGEAVPGDSGKIFLLGD